MANTNRWSYKAGEKGRNRVRVYEDRKSGRIMLEWWESEPGDGVPRRRTKSLGHSDRFKAKRTADEVAAALARKEWDSHSAPTLRQLFDIYMREVTPTKSIGTQKHDRRTAEMLLRFLGSERKADTLSVLDWRRFIQSRRTGAIRPSSKAQASPVGNRQIEQDLKWLLAVLNWATLAHRCNGRPFLDRNPLKGLPIPREENPKRPMMTHERFGAMLAVAAKVDWRFELALLLAKETGHRIGAIRMLRWSDIDFPGRRIRWRAEHDKMGKEHVTPLTEVAIQALYEARQLDPAIGDAWVFPAPKDREKPSSRHLFTNWWSRAEALAGLESVPQLGWHGLRRLFATELKDVPMKDLCQLGGWSGPQTLLKCYQQADEGTMRAALENRRRIG